MGSILIKKKFENIKIDLNHRIGLQASIGFLAYTLPGIFLGAIKSKMFCEDRMLSLS